MAYSYSQISVSNAQQITFAGVSGDVTVRMRLTTDMSAAAPDAYSNYYIYDGRWLSDTGSGYLYKGGYSGISEGYINGILQSHVTDVFNAVAGDTVELAIPAGSIGSDFTLFGRYTYAEFADHVGIDQLEIDDANGTHVFSFPGTGNTFPDSLGIITATIHNAPADDSEWVYYSAGGTTTTPNPVTETDQTLVGSFALAFTGSPESETTSLPAPITSKSIAPAAITETDAVIAPDLALAVTGSPVTETDATVSPGTAHSFTTQPLVETDQSVSPVVALSYAGQPVNETDAARVPVSALYYSPTLITETDVAISGQTTITFAGQPANETDQLIAFQSGSSVSPNPVAETDQVLVPILTLTARLDPVTELDSTPQTLFAKRFIGTIVEEIDTPIGPALAGAFSIPPLSESDALIAPLMAVSFAGTAITESDSAPLPDLIRTASPDPVQSLNTPVVGIYSLRGVLGFLLEVDRVFAPVFGNQFVFRPELMTISSATPNYKISSKTPIYTISK